MADFDELPDALRNKIIAARDAGWAKLRDQPQNLDHAILVYERLSQAPEELEAQCAQFVLDCLLCIRGELKYRELTGNLD